MADDLELRIARLELEPGDILVVEAKEVPERDMLAGLVPPGVRVLYIPPDVKLSILTKAEIDARAIG
jgi:hypothetical protein